jgi:hypothetical protein
MYANFGQTLECKFSVFRTAIGLMTHPIGSMPMLTRRWMAIRDSFVSYYLFGDANPAPDSMPSPDRHGWGRKLSGLRTSANPDCCAHLDVVD